MQYNKIFEKGKIGNHELKNRIVMPAMGTGLASENGEVNDAMIKYYEERAKAGCGLIITELSRIDQDTGVGLINQIQLTDSNIISNIKKLTEAVHKYGSKLVFQLQHPGSQTNSWLLPDDKKIVAPSPVASKIIGEIPEELTTRNIQVIISRFAIAAKIAQNSGADGIEIHAAHGYLISQFMSPNTNLRNDKYGGNIYNRLNFLKEIIAGIRQFCGKDFIIIVRMNGDDFVPGGLELEEAVQMAKIIETFEVDALNISCGTYESSHTIIEPDSYKEAWKKYLAKEIKANVDLPIIASNNLKSPKTANKMLEEDVSDFVALGRAQLADSQWVEKAYNGEDSDITNCISCLLCINSVMQQARIKCSVNQRLGLEYKYPLDN